jgi:hypothetical protein
MLLYVLIIMVNFYIFTIILIVDATQIDLPLACSNVSIRFLGR